MLLNCTSSEKFNDNLPSIIEDIEFNFSAKNN